MFSSLNRPELHLQLKTCLQRVFGWRSYTGKSSKCVMSGWFYLVGWQMKLQSRFACALLIRWHRMVKLVRYNPWDKWLTRRTPARDWPWTDGPPHTACTCASRWSSRSTSAAAARHTADSNQGPLENNSLSRDVGGQGPEWWHCLSR